MRSATPARRFSHVGGFAHGLGDVDEAGAHRLEVENQGAGESLEVFLARPVPRVDQGEASFREQVVEEVAEA